MNLKKAIEIGTDLLGEGPQFSPDDRRDAVKLLIEAGKSCQKSREIRWYSTRYKLPGETEE